MTLLWFSLPEFTIKYFLDGYLGERWTGSMRDIERMPPNSINLDANVNSNRSNPVNNMSFPASVRTSSDLLHSSFAATAAALH